MTSTDLLTASYDRSAPGYDARFATLQRPKYEALLGAGGELLAGRTRVLDLGCGTGLLGAWLHEVGGSTDRLVGVDRSEGMLAVARGRGLAVQQADAADLPFDDGAFDAVVSFTVLGLAGVEVGPVLDEVARVLAPGGLAAISVLARTAGPALVEAMEERGFAVRREVPCGQDVGFVAVFGRG